MPDDRSVQIVEVGPRDGYQGIGPFIPTGTKIEILQRLFDAGPQACVAAATTG